MKCQHINRVPILANVVIGGASIGNCMEDALPGMLYCGEHVDKDALIYAYKVAYEELKKRDPEFIKRWEV